ncbi:MAG: c-type heme family protein [Planctomycetota bacterium]
MENKYPYDQAFGYKEGDVRGGISIIISLED